MSGEKSGSLDAAHGLAADMTQRASAFDRTALEGEAAKRGIIKPGQRMSSEDNHRLAASIAREQDARRGR
jgi:hypothetical protein